MGMGRADEDDEVEVEGVADAFEDAHQSDDDGDYDANAEPEESDDDEEDGGIMSPSKIALAKAEKARLREQKKMQRAELEKMREQQNAAIAKVSANARMSRLSARSLPPGPSRASRLFSPSPRGTRGALVARAPSRALVSTRSRARTAPTIVSDERARPASSDLAANAPRARFTTASARRGRREIRSNLRAGTPRPPTPIFFILLVSPALTTPDASPTP